VARQQIGQAVVGVGIDDEFINILIRKTLTQAGFNNVFLESSGKKALEFWESERGMRQVFVELEAKKDWTGNLEISKKKDEKKSIGVNINNMISEYSIEEWGEEWVKYYRDVELINNVFSENRYWGIRILEMVKELPENMMIDKLAIGDNKMWINASSIVKAEELDYGPVRKYIDLLNEGTDAI